MYKSNFSLRSTPVIGTLIGGLCIAALLISHAAIGQTAPQPAAVTPANAANKAAPQTVAIIAAVGDQFQFVRKKRAVGSNIEPFYRQTVQVDSQALNFSVLQGLSRALTSTEPDTQQVMLRFDPTGTEKARIEKSKNSEREKAVFSVVEDNLRNIAERKQWDRIIAVTPKYLFTEANGMGSKLSGIGVYEQPLAATGFEGGDLDNVSPVDGKGDDATYGPGKPGERKVTNSSRYIAPFFYFTITTFDAKTMKVLKQETRWDYIKMFDPDSTAIDIRKMFTPEQLAESLTSLVERSSRTAIAGEGIVEVGPARVVGPAGAASAPGAK